MALALRPDVVLLDIGLPEMDGYEVARRLRSQPELNEVLLVALTGYVREDDLRRSREAGFDHHLSKPVDFDVLKELLAERRSLEPSGTRGTSNDGLSITPGKPPFSQRNSPNSSNVVPGWEPDRRSPERMTSRIS